MHSGLTPDLALAGQTLEDFLTLEPEAKPIVPPPMPGQTVDPTMQAILDGVNELRATTVTRATLREFQQLQSEEMRTFMRAETAPLHDAVGQLTEDVSELRAKVVQIEKGGGSGGSRRGKGVDDSFQKLAVVGFEANVGMEARLAAMKTFMETNFPKIDARYSIIHSGSWKEKGRNRKMSGVGLIDVGCPDLRELLIKSIESKGLKVQSGGKDLKVARAKSQSARDRDGALAKASVILKKQAGVEDKDVSIERDGGTRGVKVRNIFAFTQPAGVEMGSFCGEFSHLKLP